jgi:predicted AAA+ superfamily ATPase
MLGQLQDAGNTVTLANYLQLLNRAGLMTGLEKFSGSRVRQKLSSPKLLVRNTAFLSSIRPDSLHDILKKPEAWGRIIESTVGAHLVNSCENNGISVWYWRYEVDFVIHNVKRILGIEIKSGTKKTGQGFDRFIKNFPEAKIILVGEGGIPWQKFLKADPADLF